MNGSEAARGARGGSREPAPERSAGERDAAARPALSIVIPAFDECERLPASLARIAEHLGAERGAVEVVVVDDGSADDTAGAAERAGAAHGLSLRVLRHAPNRGKGFAARRGMLDARGAAILLTDADLSVPIEHLGAFRDRLAAGARVVSGSRHAPGARIAVHQPAFRERLGGAFRGLAARLVAPGISDFTCGFKLFAHDAAREIFGRQRLWGWGYDVEILFIARRCGIAVEEAPVEWRDDRRTRVRLWRDAPRSLLDLLRIRWNDLRGLYAEPAPLPPPAADAVCAAPRAER
jgi:dolichyl-phosphate beta-glucosyltransferase